MSAKQKELFLFLRISAKNAIFAESFKEDQEMKTNRILLTLFLLLSVACASNAQYIRSTTNSIILRVDNDGTVRRSNNSIIARIDRNGYIKSPNNRPLLKMESDGHFRMPNNRLIGQIDSYGYVRNINNSMLGKVSDDGVVRDKNNHILGYAQGVPRNFAAVYFFFNCLEDQF